jgi:hypothetical protein
VAAQDVQHLDRLHLDAVAFVRDLGPIL